MITNQKQLLEACRVLFGEGVLVTPEFLNYLQKDGVVSAFRKKAFEVHPDRTALNGHNNGKSEELFATLCRSRDLLLQFLQSKDIPNPRNGDLEGRENNAVEKRLLFGRFLYNSGVITWSELLNALAWQKMTRPKIGELGMQQGFFSRDTILTVLKHSRANRAFGLTAVDLGLLTWQDLQQLLAKQKQLQKKIGQYFTVNNLLTEEEVRFYLKELQVAKKAQYYHQSR